MARRNVPKTKRWQGPYETLCLGCSKETVTKNNRIGPPPRCETCKLKSKEARNARLQVQRNSTGIDSHRNSDGVRYSDHTTMRIFQCHYCMEAYSAQRQTKKVPVCPECLDRHRDELRKRGVQRSIEAYHRDPDKVLRQRLKRRLDLIGLSMEWYDAKISEGCEICRVTEFVGVGWHIDHDHSCCSGEWHTSCGACVRGVLCHNCNIALGLLKEDPAIFERAVQYLSRSEGELL